MMAFLHETGLGIALVIYVAFVVVCLLVGAQRVFMPSAWRNQDDA